MLESLKAIKEQSYPVRLSEQEGLDCIDSISCEKRGDASTYLHWSAEHGSMSYKNYPYEERDAECRHQEVNKPISAQVKPGSIAIHDLDKDRTLEDVMHHLKEHGPMLIRISALCDVWYSYKSGIMTSEMMASCPNANDPDYFAVLVGVHIPEVCGGREDEEFNRICRWATQEERTAEKCESLSMYQHETMEPNRYGEKHKKCCHYESIGTGSDCDEDDQEEPYWIVQMSWSRLFGMDGLIHLAIEDGRGVANMNDLIMYADVL